MSILKIKDEKGNIIEIPVFKGDKGEQGLQGIQGEKGDKGDKGEDYALTEKDKTDIADIVLQNFVNVAEVGQ